MDVLILIYISTIVCFHRQTRSNRVDFFLKNKYFFDETVVTSRRGVATMCENVVTWSYDSWEEMGALQNRTALVTVQASEAHRWPSNYNLSRRLGGYEVSEA
jgi:hypothetical protein